MLAPVEMEVAPLIVVVSVVAFPRVVFPFTVKSAVFVWFPVTPKVPATVALPPMLVSPVPVVNVEAPDCVKFFAAAKVTSPFKLTAPVPVLNVPVPDCAKLLLAAIVRFPPETSNPALASTFPANVTCPVEAKFDAPDTLDCPDVGYPPVTLDDKFNKYPPLYLFAQSGIRVFDVLCHLPVEGTKPVHRMCRDFHHSINVVVDFLRYKMPYVSLTRLDLPIGKPAKYCGYHPPRRFLAAINLHTGDT
jgi:hypothetical protein